MQLSIDTPSTVYISFLGAAPRCFCVYNASDELYYFRYPGGASSLKFNIPDVGGYYTNSSISVDRINGIETPANYPMLPPAERARWKDVVKVYNPKLAGTPCCIYSDTGIIEYNDEFLSYPKPIQEFLFDHEKGHLLYKTEEYCDLFALINYLRKGYNRSMAYYALYYILNDSAENINRLSYIFFNIKDCTGEFAPYV